MADPSTNLRVRISADLADIKQGLGVLRGDLAAVKRQAAASMSNMGSNAAIAGVRRLRAEVVGLAATYLSMAGAKVLTGMADEATLLRGRIRQAKGDYEAILAVAQETRSGLSATVDLYARVERSTRGQIKNQGDLLTLTKSVNQAIQLSYTGTAAGEAAILQLGQALGSGTLSGDELKSLRENAPRLAQAIADGMGVAVGKLKELGKEGKLTTDVVVKALLTQSKVLQQEYSQIPLTIGGAFTQIRNALLDYIGDQDNATGASRRFAETLQKIAKDLPRYLDPVLKAFTLLLENIDTLAVYMVARLAGAAIPALITGFTAVRAMLIASAGAAATLRGALMLLGGPVGIAVAALAAGLYYLYQRTNQASVAAKEHTKALAANAEMARSDAKAALQDASAKRTLAIETLNSAKALLAERLARSQSTSLMGGGTIGASAAFASSAAVTRQQQAVNQARKEVEDWTRQIIGLQLEIQQTEIAGVGAIDTADTAATDKADKAKKAVKGIIDQSELAQDAIKRELEALEALYERAGISIADYYAKKQALQLADIDAQIRQQEQEAKTATTSEQQSRAMTQIIKLQRERAAIGPKAAEAQAKAEEELTKQLGQVHIRLMQLRGDTARASTLELEERYLELIQKLEANPKFGQAGAALVRKLINLEAAGAQLQEFERKMQEVMGRLQGKETSVSSLTEAGMLSPFEGERQLQELRAVSLQQLRDLRQAASDYLATLSTDNPATRGVIDFLNQIDSSIAQVTASTRRLVQQAAQVAISSLTTFFTDLASGTKSAKDALKDFVRSFVAGMAEIAARALATYLVLQLLDAIYPGLGKATAAMMSAGQHHAGGVVGRSGGVRRSINPMMLGQAPNYYHGGGTVGGLRSNEELAVLEVGERVRTRAQEAQLQQQIKGGGDRVVVKQPILAFGDRQLTDAVAQAAGMEDVIVTMVENNWTRLNRAAG